MNPRRAPGPRPALDAEALRRHLDALRAAYDGMAPRDPFFRRVADAVRTAGPPVAVRRGRRRRLAVVAVGLVLALGGGVVLGRFTAQVGPGARFDAAATPASSATTAPRPAPGLARTARLDGLLASARALPRPDAATRAGWVLAALDADPEVRAAARGLLRIADGLAPPVEPPPRRGGGEPDAVR